MAALKKETNARVVVLGGVPAWRRGLPSEVLRYFILHRALIPERSPNAAPSAAYDAVMRARLEPLRPFFHSPFNFGDGLTTKPPHTHRRFRRRLQLLGIPDDLSGKTVLDIGAWDGFFSFEFERRGAKRVLAIDTYAWDHGGLECFLLAHEHFKSKVEHQRLDVHDLSPQEVGTFDLVFCAGVLYHMRHPLLALERSEASQRATDP